MRKLFVYVGRLNDIAIGATRVFGTLIDEVKFSDNCHRQECYKKFIYFNKKNIVGL